MDNVELFELYAGVVLGQLYKRFPIPMELKPDDLIGRIQQHHAGHDHSLEIVGHTIRWLERSGYIEDTRARNSVTFRGTLTAKGFECLRALPKSLKKAHIPASRQSLGEQLEDLAADGVKEGAKDAVKGFVKDVLSTGVAMGITAAGRVFSG